MANTANYRFNFQARGNLIGGKWLMPTDPSGEWICRSPADFSDEYGKVTYSYTAINEAISSARQAFPAWRRTSVADRGGFLRNYQAALKRREDQIVEAIAREVGKPLWESRTEFSAMVNKIDITLKESMRFVTDFELPKLMENTTGMCRYRPMGVLAVIGPFNFPGHLPNGHIVPALLTGNTVVFKPSEKCPLVGQLVAECLEESGLPPGVFNLVQGEKEIGRRLCVHEGVDGILFTGSYEVGTRIKQDTLQQHWKLLALEMGGKNSAIVWEDADLELALYETLTGAYLTAGQRCSATSRLLVHSKVIDAFLSRFHERAKAFTIGHPLDEPFMGPLIDQGSVDRYLKFLGIASRENCEIVMHGKILEPTTRSSRGTRGNYVTPSICHVKSVSLESTRKSVYQQTELFAPNVAILEISDLDEAIAQANATQYGLANSVFCKDRAIYDKCLDGLQSGLINWNKSTVGASSKLPFGGLKKSGNHFPTALMATMYCTVPVASLECNPELSQTTPVYPPGLNWLGLA